MFSTSEMLTTYLKSTPYRKSWSGHDRSDTIGASEIGLCARRVWLDKQDTAPDPNFVQDWGAAERGNSAENWVVAGFEYALKQNPGAGISLIWTGDNQQTLVEGAQSATPDGLFIGQSIEVLCPVANAVVSVSCLYNEIKSIDPRAFDYLTKPKQSHVLQVTQGMDLVRRLTPHKPEYAVITYVDASFFSNQKEWIVKFDQAVADGLRERAVELMHDFGLNEQPWPEGMIAGGDECGWCPYKQQCNAYNVDRIKRYNKVLDTLPADVDSHLAELVAMRTEANTLGDKWTKLRKEFDQKIIDVMDQVGASKIKRSWGGLTRYEMSSPPVIDDDKLKALNISRADITKPGAPYARLNVTPK